MSPWQYLLQTQRPVAGLSAPDLAALFAPPRRWVALHGGQRPPYPMPAQHLGELDLAALAAARLTDVLVYLPGHTEVHWPDLEALVHQLTTQLPSPSTWLYLSPAWLGYAPLYLDAWGFAGAWGSGMGAEGDVLVGGGMVEGLPAHAPPPPDAHWQTLAQAQGLPEVWNTVQGRARAFRAHLAAAGGKVFGGVTTHLYTCFTHPAAQALAAEFSAELTQLMGTGSAAPVFRVWHTQPSGVGTRLAEWG